MGKSKKTKKKDNAAQQKKPERLEGKRDGDDNSLRDVNADDYLVNYLMTPSDRKDTIAEDGVFVDQSDASDKVCPKCGMPLVDQYCMGCGMSMKVTATNYTNNANSAFYKETYVTGSGYGGGNAYVARQKALYKKPKKKKNILEENGLAGFLLIFLGIAAGFLIGVLVLKMYFAPKNQEVILYREAKVTKIAQIKTIKAGKTSSLEMPIQDAKGQAGSQKSNKGNQSTQNAGGSNAQPSSPQKTSQNQKNEFFYGDMTIQALGDKVTNMEEVEEWDTTGINPNDVIYVINNLNHLYEKYQYQVFVENEITQEGNKVKVHFVFRNLDLKENREAMVRLGVISEMVMAGPDGRRYISLQKLQEELKGGGWKLKEPANEKASSSPTPATVTN